MDNKQLCSSCGLNPRAGKKSQCNACRTETNRLYRQNEVDHGRCYTGDGNAVTAGLRFCEKCRDTNKRGVKKYQARLVKSGLCRWGCGETARPGFQLCAKCNETGRRYQIEKNYGLTHEDYLKKLVAQDGRCAICRRTPEETDGRRLSVDHHHATKQLRDLLCNGCNTAIGLLEESPGAAFNAAVYLARWGHLNGMTEE